MGRNPEGTRVRKSRWTLKLSAMMRGRDWTSKEWEKRTGVSEAAIRNYRRGDRFPTRLDDLENILSALDTDLSAFFVASEQYPKDTANLHDLLEGLYRSRPDAARRAIDALTSISGWLETAPPYKKASGGTLRSV